MDKYRLVVPVLETRHDIHLDRLQSMSSADVLWSGEAPPSDEVVEEIVESQVEVRRDQLTRNFEGGVVNYGHQIDLQRRRKVRILGWRVVNSFDIPHS
jgi:hypothetical protein